MSHIEALDLGHAPRHLIVLGGGYVGLELAQAMRRFGSQVTIVERGKQLAGREDPDVGAALFELFKDEGIQVLLNTEMRDVAGRSGQQIRITLDGANGGRIAPPRSRAGRKSRRRNSRTVIGRCVGLFRVLVHDRCCLRRLLGHGVERPGWLWAALRRNGVRTLLQPLKLGRQWIDEAFLKNVFVVVVLALLRILLYLIMGEPVGLLKLAGGIEAAHIPIVTGLILYLNGRMLPHDLRLSRVVCTATAAAGLFFAAFAGIYVSSW